MKYRLEKGKLNDHGQPVVRKFNTDRLIDRAIDELIGICKGIIIDKSISDEEVQFLIHWLEVNKDQAHIWPASVLVDRINYFLSDNVIDAQEKEDLLNILTQVSGSSDIANMSTSLPLCSPAPDIVFNARRFCLTGKFLYGPRKKCEYEIITRGGQAQSAPTQETDYLIIGCIGSTDWIHSTHGRKIEYAIELKSKGSPIAIISEEHWSNFLK